MSKFYKFCLFLLRVSMGWVMFYAGIVKILDPQWSAVGYLANAKTFPGFFAWFIQPNILPVTNLLNEWGLTILGISLMLGLFARFTSAFGVLLMMLYYFPVLQFPHIPLHSYIIDDHVIYALILLFFSAAHIGRIWGLDALLSRKSSGIGRFLS